MLFLFCKQPKDHFKRWSEQKITYLFRHSYSTIKAVEFLINKRHCLIHTHARKKIFLLPITSLRKVLLNNTNFVTL